MREGGPEISRGRKATATEIKALCEKASLKCLRKGIIFEEDRIGMIQIRYDPINIVKLSCFKPKMT